MAAPALAADDAPALGQDDPAAQAGLEKQELTRQQAIAKARADERIDDWVRRYDGVTTSAGLDADGNRWTVHFRVPGKDAGEIAQAVVDSHSGQVLEAWTGPQVAWKMARGYRDAFGHKLNRPAIWLAFCLAFLVVVIDWRRPLRLLNLDLLVLIAFSFSLGAFNEGMIFWSVPLAYPPLLYLTGRLGWIGVKGRRQGAWTGKLPIWALAGLAVFLIGFRGGLNAYDSGVIDVGYAGVVGADRIISGTTPYGTIPERTSDGCGPKFSDGNYSAYRQESGRCESFAVGIDTYGPLNYAAYVPAVAALGWTGRWDDLPAAHVTSLVFDALTGIGLLLLGRRLRGWRLGALLSCAWFAYPFTAYALQSNSNDMIVSALLVWALLAATHPLARGVFLGLAALAKFAPALLIPLWLRYPRRERPSVEEWTPGEAAPPPPAGLRARATGLFRDLGPWRPVAAFVGGLLCSTLVAVIVLWPGGIDGVRDAYDATFGKQLNRESPFSLWDWHLPKNRPDFPDLSPLESLLRILIVGSALLVALVPRRLDMVRLAALSGALLGAFQIVLSHWSYLYLPWLFVPAIVALCAPSAED